MPGPAAHRGRAARSRARRRRPRPPGPPARPAGRGRDHHPDPLAQRGVQDGDLPPIGPFCGPKTAEAPASPSSGLSTSAASSRLHPRQPGVGGPDQPVHLAQRRPARRQPLAGGVEPVHPEGGQRAGAAVVRPRPAQADDHPARAGAERDADQLPDPVGRRRAGPALRRREQVQPAGLGALHVGDVARHQHRRRDRAGERPLDGGHHELAAQGCVQHVDEAGAAVGQRRKVDGVPRRRPQPAVADRRRRLAGGQRAPEGVGRDQDPHPRSLPVSRPGPGQRVRAAGSRAAGPGGRVPGSGSGRPGPGQRVRAAGSRTAGSRAAGSGQPGPGRPGPGQRVSRRRRRVPRPSRR